MTQYRVGLLLTADGDGLKGEVRLSKEALDDLARSAKSAERPVEQTGKALDRTGREARQAAGDIARADRAAGRMGRGGMALAKGAVAGFGSALAGISLGAFIADAIRTEAQFERLTSRVTFFAGSAQAASRELNFAAQAADRLATSESLLIDTRARLLPLEQAGLLARENGLAITEGLIDASKALGAEQAQLGQVMYGLASPIVRAEELNQVVEPLPGLLQAMDRSIREMSSGATRSFRELVNEGEATSDLFARVLVDALGEFEGAGARSVDTIDGKLTRLSNNWERFQRSVVDSELVKLWLEGASQFLADITPAPPPPIDEQIADLDERLARGTVETPIGPSGATRQREMLAIERQRLIDRRTELDIQRQIAVEAEKAASAKAEADVKTRAREGALGLLDAAPRTLEQKSEEIRSKIAAINAEIEAGTIRAQEAAPALAAYAEQLDKLLNPKSSHSRNPLEKLRDGLSEELDAARLSKLGAELDALVQARDRAGLADVGRAVAQSFGTGDVGGFSSLEANRAAIEALVSEFDRLKGTLAGSGIDLAADGLPADPKLRAEVTGNAEAIARLAGEEAERRAVMARPDAAKEIYADLRRELEGMAPSYENAVAAATRWRNETLEGIEGAGLALDDFSELVDQVYGGRLAAARQEQADLIGGLQGTLEGMRPTYESAVASADRWREETVRAMERAGIAVADYGELVAQIHAGKLEAARRRDVQMIDGLRATLEGMRPTYTNAVASATRWRDETVRSMEEAGIAASEYGALVEGIFGEKIKAAGRRNAQMIDGLRATLEGMRPTYANAVASATRWRDETVRSMETAGIAASEYGALVEDIFGEKIAAAERRNAQMIDGLRATLEGMRPSYANAVASATRWRDGTVRSMEEAGIAASEYGDLVEDIFEGKIAAARRREEALLDGLRASLEATRPSYENAVAAATRWRDATVRSMEEAGISVERYGAMVESLYSEKLEAGRRREKALIDGIRDALQSVDPTYERAAAAAEDWRDETVAALEEAGIATEAHAAQVETILGLRLEAAYRADLERREDWAAGIERGLADINDDLGDWASQSESILSDWSSAGEDAFVRLATTGKLEFGDMVDTILSDLARLAYRQTIAPVVNQGFSGLLGGLGSLFGGGGGLGSLFGGGGGGQIAGVWHSGGTIGEAGPTRALPLTRADIAAAPRYHRGGMLGDDERLIVGQVGERISTPRQWDTMTGTMNALAALAARPAPTADGPVININTAPELAVRETRRPDGGVDIDIYRQFEDRLNAETAAGRGVAPGVQRRFGLNQSFNGRR